MVDGQSQIVSHVSGFLDQLSSCVGEYFGASAAFVPPASGDAPLALLGE